MAKGKYEKWLEPEGLTLLTGWARDGLTDEQLARNMHISASTLYEWKKKYSEISEALKRGKEVADYAVENALFNEAMNGNVAAIIFWLKNRKPKHWRDKPIDEGDVAQQLEHITKVIRGEAEDAIHSETS